MTETVSPGLRWIVPAAVLLWAGCNSTPFAVAFEKGEIVSHAWPPLEEPATVLDPGAWPPSGYREIGSFLIVPRANVEGDAVALHPKSHGELKPILQTAVPVEAAARGATLVAIHDESRPDPDRNHTTNPRKLFWFPKLRATLYRQVGDGEPAAPRADRGPRRPDRGWDSYIDYAVVNETSFEQPEPSVERAEVLETEADARARGLTLLGSFELVPAANAVQSEQKTVKRGPHYEQRFALWRSVPGEAARRGATAVVIRDTSTQVPKTLPTSSLINDPVTHWGGRPLPDRVRYFYATRVRALTYGV